ncbi:hypothetical protein EXIGLDRAFT_773880 [Exidia glandulosa HHB12029]|uniref:Uncharacterized protein n=1 Tax=Exidia glandulosa HHB12029 TaxID=1314781 RepID=A0A165ELK7_EXIGL|nr:hypothetical protein EXIGLDRAFT_773880 [Exidia glandulosa HHB12029]
MNEAKDAEARAFTGMRLQMSTPDPTGSHPLKIQKKSSQRLRVEGQPPGSLTLESGTDAAITFPGPSPEEKEAEVESHDASEDEELDWSLS